MQLALLSEQPLVLEGFAALCSHLDQAAIGWVCTSQDELSAAVAAGARPDVILVDLSPEANLAAMAELCRRVKPGKVLLVARRISPELAYQAREFGAAAVLNSRSSLAGLADAVRRVERGEIILDDVLSSSLQDARTVKLTPREGQLVSLLAQGLKNKEIAYTLGISEGTVKVYLSKLFHKVGAKDRFELALFGLKNVSNASFGMGENGLGREQPGSGVKVHNLHSLVMRTPPSAGAPHYPGAAAG
jgi:DNA-binding NarL/FixJ family response regulator